MLPLTLARKLCVLALGFAILIFEMALARICSALFSYHFSFLAVSFALLGLGLGGMWVARRPALDMNTVARCCTGFVGGTFVFLWASFRLPLRPNFQLEGLLRMGGLAALGTAPFVLAGVALCVFLRRHREQAGSVYAADLAGGALACLAINPMLDAFGPVITVGLGALAMACAGVASAESRQLRGLNSAALALCLGLCLSQWQTGWLRMDTIELEEKRLPVTFDVWNSLSRISVIEKTHTAQFIMDAGADTWVDPPENGYYYASEAAFSLRPNGRFAVIGPGAGPDVLMGTFHKPQSFDLVEINPTMIELVKGRYAQMSGNIYNRPEVTIHIADGRSYMQRTRQQFDVLVISLVDTFAAVSGGAHALTENFIYTVDAVRAYLHRVQPGGVVCITRWYSEAGRLTVLARTALEQEGIQDPHLHLFGLMSRGDNVYTLLISARPWTSSELQFLHQHADENGLKVVLEPSTDANTQALAALAQKPLAPLLQASSLDLSPADDDRPFFLFFYKAAAIVTGTPEGALILPGPKPERLDQMGSGRWAQHARTMLIMAFPLLLGCIGSAFLWATARDTPRSALLTVSLLGVGFMLFEISLSQKLVLLLGHPSYAISNVLFGFLVFGALGAALSERVPQNRSEQAQAAAAVAVALIGVAASLLYPGYAAYFLNADQWQRTLAALAWIAPLGVCIGMPFPLLLRRVAPSSVPQVWGLNGTASVAGSSLAVVLSLLLGFGVTTVTAGACYLLVAAVALRSRRT